MNIYIHIISYYGDTIFIKWYVLHIYFIVLQGSRMVKILKSRTNLAKYCRIWLDGSSGVHPRNCFGIAGRVPHPLYKPCIIQPIIISYTCQTVSRPTKKWLPDFILLKLSDKYLNLHHHCHLVYNYVLFGKYMTVMLRWMVVAPNAPMVWFKSCSFGMSLG